MGTFDVCRHLWGLFRFAVVSKGVDKVILFFLRGAGQTMDSSVNQSMC